MVEERLQPLRREESVGGGPYLQSAEPDGSVPVLIEGLESSWDETTQLTTRAWDK